MAGNNTQKKVTEHFGPSVTRGNRISKGNRKVTEFSNLMLPRNPLLSCAKTVKGNRVTEEIEIIVYIYNKGNKRKIGRNRPQKDNIQQNGFFCYSVTSTAFREVSA